MRCNARPTSFLKDAIFTASLTCLIALGGSVAYAEVLELEGTIKAIDQEARSVSIVRQTPKGEKVLDLEIAKTVGDISTLKVGNEVSFSYNPNADIITQISSRTSTQSAEDAYRAKVAAHLEKCQQGLAAIHEDYVASIKKQMEDLTKAGDLDGAVAVRAKLKNAQRFTESTNPRIISDIGASTWKDQRGHSYSFFPDGTCLGDGPGKYNAPCFAVGKDALLVCWYQGSVVGAYDLFVWNEDRTEYKRHHFQIEKDTQPLSSGTRASASNAP
jgi:hypothetical protein